MSFVFLTITLGAHADAQPPSSSHSDPGGDSVDLRLVAGKVYGQVENQPLSRVLLVIARQSNLVYRAPDVVLERRVTGKFDGIPLTAVLKRLLAPSSYVLISHPTGEAKELIVMQSTGDFAQYATNHSPDDTSDQNDSESEVRDNSEHQRQEDRFLQGLPNPTGNPTEFEELTRSTGTGSRESGPTPEAVRTDPLPPFRPAFSSTGPPEPESADLPAFEPRYTEGGPVVPNPVPANPR